MQTITQELLDNLKNVTDIKAFLDSHEKDFLSETPVSYLNYMIGHKGATLAKVAQASGVGEYVYKVFSGERKPSRDVLIAVSFGLGISFEETQLLLRISKFAILDSRDKRDSVVIYGLMNGLSVFDTNDALAENSLLTLI